MRCLTRILVCGLLLGVASCSSGSDPRSQAQATKTRQAETPISNPDSSPRLRSALAHLLNVIHSKGYESSVSELRKAGEFYSGLRPVLVAKPTYLSNGFRCANVFFFSDGQYVGRDSASCHLDPQIDWGASREISIVYPPYAKHDALCCPTPNPKRVIFRLVGAHMKGISGALPRPPG